MMTVTEAQVFWITGALERLATLGFLKDPPYQVSQMGIDMFVQLDELRDKLFVDNQEMKNILSVMLKSENGFHDEDLLDGMYVLLKDYKDDRSRIVKYALELSK